MTVPSNVRRGGLNGGRTQPITITLQGTNDAPVITAATASGSVTELTGVTGSTALDTVSGTITFTDLDLIDTHTASAVAQGVGYVGTLTPAPATDGTGSIAGTGAWAFS